MIKDIMTIEDFNEIPEGTELNYKSGGYGWWLGDEECGSRGGRKINGSLMHHLLQLGVGMKNRRSVASHQVRFYVETEPVDAGKLVNSIDDLEEIWHNHNIRREYELREAFADIKGFQLTEFTHPRCYWARSKAWEEKSFLYNGFEWVYCRAQYLNLMPRKLIKIRFCLSGRDLAAESRAEMRAVA